MSRKSWLWPDLYLERIIDITPELLAEHGLRALIMDADNTLVPRSDYVLDKPTAAWIERLQAAGVKFCILSNSMQARAVGEMVAPYGIPTLSRARKPAKAGFYRALRAIDATIDETAMVGDQLFTDIVGGNRMGMTTIMVKQVTTNDFIVYRLLGRTLERPLMARWHAARK